MKFDTVSGMNSMRVFCIVFEHKSNVPLSMFIV